MEIYLTGEFTDIQNRTYTITIFEETDSLLTPFNWGLFGSEPLIIEHSANVEDNFSRVLASQAKIQFVAQNQSEADILLALQTSTNHFNVRVEREGEYFWGGRILQDLGVEQNKPFPRVYTVEARDMINEIFKRSAELLVAPSTSPFAIELVNIQKIWFRALESANYSGFGDIKIRANSTWTNDNNTVGGNILARNYLGTYVLIAPLCFFSGTESEQILGQVGNIYTQTSDTYFPYSPGQAATTRAVNKYYSIAEVVNGFLEALDLVMFFDNGVFWFVQRELWHSTSAYFADSESDYELNTTPPLYGATSGQTLNFNFKPENVYSQGLFSGMQRAWKLRHLFVNQRDPIYDEGVRDTSTAPDYFWLYDQFNFPVPLIDAPRFIGGVNEASFDLIKVSIDIDITIDRWDSNPPINLLYISARIFTANGQSYTGQNWVANTNQNFLIGDIRPFGSSASGSVYNRKVNFLMPPPDGLAFTDVFIELKLVTAWGDPLANYLDNRATNPNLIRGSVRAEEARGGFINTGGILFEQTAGENTNAQTIFDRGRLIYENVRSIKPQYLLSTLRNGSAPFDDETFAFQENWRRLNNSPGRTLAALRGYEMMLSVRRVQKMLDVQFRHQPSYIGLIEPIVNLYGVNWRWINRKFDAKKSLYDGRLLEAVRQTGTGVFTGNPINSNEPRSTQLTEGFIMTPGGGGGRLATNSLTTLSAPFAVGSPDEGFAIAPMPYNIPSNVLIRAYDLNGMQVGSFITSAPVTAGSTVLPFSNLEQVAYIPEGAYLEISPNDSMQIALDAGGDKTYFHEQSSALNVWTISHNLGKRPSIQTFDSAGSQIFGEVEHLDLNTSTVTFASNLIGTATAN